MKPLAEILLDEIEAFLAKHDMAATTFGRHVVNDGHFVFDLRRSRNVTSNQIDRVRAFMATYARGSRRRRSCSRPAA